MLVVSFFSWWYGKGWQGVAKNIGPRLNGVMQMFSVTQLLRTLFSPWRRIITYPGSSFAEKFRAWGDNVFSRAVGFVVRTVVLFTALLVIILTAVLSVIELVFWPLIPIAVPGLLILGII